MSGAASIAADLHIRLRARLWLYAIAALLLLFLVLPTLIVIPMSFSDSTFLEFPPRHLSLRWYRHFLDSPAWRQAAATSLKVAAATAVVATVLGTAAAYGLFASGLRRARLLSGVLLAPIIVPGILVAIGIFYVYVQIGLVNSLAGLVLADAMLALPLVLIVMTAALRGYDFAQELAARSLGASRLRAFFAVTLPQLRFAVMTSAILGFLTGFDEVVIALFVSGGNNATLTRDMFNALRDQIDPTIAAISTAMIAVSSLLLAGLQALGGRNNR